MPPKSAARKSPADGKAKAGSGNESDVQAGAGEEAQHHGVTSILAVLPLTSFVLILLSLHTLALLTTLSPIYGSVPLTLHLPKIRAALALVSLATCLRVPLKPNYILPAVIVVLGASSIFELRSLAARSAWLGPTWGPVCSWVVLHGPVEVLGIWALFGAVKPHLPPYALLLLPLLPALTVPLLTPLLHRLSLFPSLASRLSAPSTWLQLLALPPSVLSLLLSSSFSVPPTLISSSPHAKQTAQRLRLASLLPIGFLFLHLLPETVAPPALPAGHRILAREVGPTGMVFVGEDEALGFRYLRAEHSLLGGLWVGPAREALEKRGGGVRKEWTDDEVVRDAESIYTTFLLQEAVRLVNRPRSDTPPNDPEKALIIGLGIGITPSAFIAHHHLNTTIVELSPPVYTLARAHFGLPEPDVLALEDARSAVGRWAAAEEEKEKEEERGTYDYVVHDVFTGGSVPGSLFTREAWADVRRVMRGDGVLAVNFAGAASSPASTLVLRTLVNAFDGNCRAFSDHAIPTDEEEPFINMVIFCTPSSSSTITFRPPTATDAFSPMRSHVFSTFHSHEVALPSVDGELLEDKGKANPGTLERLQRESAVKHWAVMREVMGDEVWWGAV